MKKLVLGGMAVIVLSATAISASKQQVVQAHVNGYTSVRDTIPGDTSRWNKNKRMQDSSMNPSRDTMQRNRPDSIPR